MSRLIPVIVALALVAGAWIVSGGRPLPDDTLAGLTPDAERGALVFAAAGCASCHMAPEDEDYARPAVLAGGKRFETQFGTFIAPNISPGPEGVGDWTDLELATAILKGVSPRGAHYYPAFPYTSYARAEPQDVADLIAHLRTLPADPTPSLDHEVGFPFNIRRSLFGWKLLFANDDWVVAEASGPELERGRYLVEALGHCGECHTPRNALGGLDRGAWLIGAPLPSGEGRVPGITPSQLGWSAGDIAAYLQSGFTPEFDVVGGEMFEVVQNMAKLTDEDRAAIAAYLVALPEG